MLKKLFLILTLMIAFPLFAAPATPIFNTPDKPIIVTEKNAVFTITLQSNPTTGFLWSVKSFDPKVVRMIGHKFVAPTNKKLIGAPGYEVYVFQVKHHAFTTTHEKTTKIALQYTRPWTKDDATKTEFIIKMQ